jgi:hypothetical protein
LWSEFNFQILKQITYAVWLTLPYWFLTLAASALAGVPWLNWSYRFNTRTLLLVTTLVAVLFGLLAALQ